jgi:hypothetical protein
LRSTGEGVEPDPVDVVLVLAFIRDVTASSTDCWIGGTRGLLPVDPAMRGDGGIPEAAAWMPGVRPVRYVGLIKGDGLLRAELWFDLCGPNPVEGEFAGVDLEDI